MQFQLTESDLKFLVETVATRRTDHDHIIGLVGDKEDFLEQMLEDPKLLERLVKEEESLVRVSPYMLFSLLMREVRRELEKTGIVYEPETRGRRIPVFDGPAALKLLSNPQAREYLVNLLCSFVRVNTGYVHWKERGTWHRRRFNDTDLDDMIALAGMADPELKPRYLKRAADIALFVSGVFPDRAVAAATQKGRRRGTERTLRDYEETGHRLYALAARETPDIGLRTVLEVLAEKFALARNALNTLSDRFLKQHRGRLFHSPG